MGLSTTGAGELRGGRVACNNTDFTLKFISTTTTLNNYPVIENTIFNEVDRWKLIAR